MAAQSGKTLIYLMRHTYRVRG